ncbi:MAG: hypothetical protein CMH54_12725 [Myxococcales bacterium]|nr:hypothetical protein [Myxococcales bacterium]
MNAQKAELIRKIESALDAIRPALLSDGGDCEVVDVSPDGTEVELKFLGACESCPSSMMTLKMGIERHLREVIPTIESVHAVAVTGSEYTIFGDTDSV